ncbi:MAG TPA: GAF domain-containing protein [Caldilineae bacterium]|nr:GAF domain-containing protein [Caldilineae bacterium]
MTIGAEQSIRSLGIQLSTTPEQRSQALAVLLQTARISASSLDPEQMAQDVLDVVVQALDAEVGTIFVYDEDAKILRLLGDHGLPQELPPQLKEIPIDHPGSFQARVMRTGEPLMVEDLSRESGIIPEGYRDIIPHAAMIVPLIARDRPIGTLAVGYLSDRRFTSRDLPLLTAIGQQVGLAIQNARWAQAAQRRATRLAAIAHLIQQINAEQDMDRLPQLTIEGVAELLEADMSMLLLSRTGRTWQHVREPNLMKVPLDQDRCEYIAKRVIETGTLIHLSSATHEAEDPLASAGNGQFAFPLIAVPLIYRCHKLGALLVARFQPRWFQSEDVELLTMFANHAAIALRNTQLHQEMEWQARQLRAMAQISAQITATLDWNALVEQIAQHASELANVPRTVLLLYDPQHREMVVVSVKGYSGDIPLNQMRFKMDRRLVGRVWRTKRPFMTPRIGDEPDYAPYPGLEEVGDWSFLFLPLLMGERLIGILAFSDEGGRIFTPTEQEVLKLLANHVAIAVANAQLFASMKARQEELIALNEIAVTMAHVQDLRHVLNLVLERLAQVIKHHGSVVLLLNGDEAQVAAARHCPRFGDKLCSHVPIDPAQERWMQGKLDLLVGERGACLLAYTPPINACTCRAWVKAPLMVQGEVIGCIAICRSSEEGFLREEAGLVQIFANHAAVAIHNARLYEALRRHSEELEAQVAARTRDLQIALERAQEADRLKSAFLATISHELRTPLASIKGFASTLLQDDVEWDPESQKEFLSIIEQESDKLTELIDQLLDMSCLESGTLEVNPTPCHVEEILTDVSDRLHVLARSHRLQISLPRDLPPVYADRGRIAQVLSNLVENAAKYSPEGSPIRISATADVAWVTVSVSDQGIGIAPEFHERIFERFFRIESEESQPGTGLGLAICRGIIEAHGGRIWVESAPRQGSTFHFTLPVAQTTETDEVDE